MLQERDDTEYQNNEVLLLKNEMKQIGQPAHKSFSSNIEGDSKRNVTEEAAINILRRELVDKQRALAQEFDLIMNTEQEDAETNL